MKIFVLVLLFVVSALAEHDFKEKDAITIGDDLIFGYGAIPGSDLHSNIDRNYAPHASVHDSPGYGAKRSNYPAVHGSAHGATRTYGGKSSSASRPKHVASHGAKHPASHGATYRGSSRTSHAKLAAKYGSKSVETRSKHGSGHGATYSAKKDLSKSKYGPKYGEENGASRANHGATYGDKRNPTHTKQVSHIHSGSARAGHKARKTSYYPTGHINRKDSKTSEHTKKDAKNNNRSGKYPTGSDAQRHQNHQPQRPLGFHEYPRGPIPRHQRYPNLRFAHSNRPPQFNRNQRYFPAENRPTPEYRHLDFDRSKQQFGFPPRYQRGVFGGPSEFRGAPYQPIFAPRYERRFLPPFQRNHQGLGPRNPRNQFYNQRYQGPKSQDNVAEINYFG